MFTIVKTSDLCISEVRDEVMADINVGDHRHVCENSPLDPVLNQLSQVGIVVPSAMPRSLKWSVPLRFSPCMLHVSNSSHPAT
jgi:hypothetical protein